MTGLMDRIMDYLAELVQKKPKLIWYSLLTDTTLTANYATYNTYGGRKISDYDVLLFIFGVDIGDMRGTAVVNKSNWGSGKIITNNILHGSTSSSASAFSVGGITVQYKNDTSFSAKYGGSGAIKHLQILGGIIQNQ